MQNAKLRAQVADERLVAKSVVRLPRADDHTLHLVDEALDDGEAVLLVLERGEVDGKLTTQLECVAGLAPCRPYRFEDGDCTLFRQSRLCRGLPRATCDRTEGGKDVPSCIAWHLRLSGRGNLPPGNSDVSRHLRQNDDRHRPTAHFCPSCAYRNA